jgi:uncharacterized protein with PQ loop repeat
MELNEIFSLIFTILSIIFYSIVFIPQFLEIYKRKNSEGVSIWSILLWCQADTLSLLGTLILQLNIGLIIIGWYHMLLGQILLIYILHNKIEKNNLKSIFIYAFVITNFLISIIFQLYYYKLIVNFIIGQIIGWISAFIYIVGRIPQVYHNFKRKSTEGLSIYMYVFSICGNIFYISSILVYSSDQNTIILTLPWIVLGIVCGIIDLFIIFQAKILYVKKQNIQETYVSIDEISV